MSLLNQPVMVTTHTGQERRALALTVDLQRELVFCSIEVPGGCASGWFPVDRVAWIEVPE